MLLMMIDEDDNDVMLLLPLLLLIATGGAGNDCLNLNFGKISHRFTRDFTNTDKKIRK